MSFLFDAIQSGLIFAILSMGIFITFKILDFPDLTVDGSFTLGCVVSSVAVLANHPILGIFIAMLAGGLAGYVTGFLHTKMKVQYILAGILTMTGLYSINLRIGSGQPYLSLFGTATIFSLFQEKMPFAAEISNFILLFIIVVIGYFLLLFFFQTPIGLAMRATGSNEHMVRVSSIDTDKMKRFGLTIANAFVALSAALFAQYQQFYEITQGIGMMVVGLTSIIIGESLLRKRNLAASLFCLIIGAIIYRSLLSYALYLGMNPNDFKLACALLTGCVICFPQIVLMIKRRNFHA